MSSDSPKTDANGLVKITRALLSVSDKTGIVSLGRFLHEHDVEILSTGGTARALRDAGIPVRMVEDWTGFPECFGGRLKTISPKIYGGLLYRRGNPSHVADANRLQMDPIDLVVCNLYPFAKHVELKSSDEELIENIDIGGPCMIRAAAKNHESVVVCAGPAHYQDLMETMAANAGCTGIDFRRRMSVAAYRATAEYDAAISAELARRLDPGCEAFPRVIDLSRQTELRYGENPHQSAALAMGPDHGVATATVLQGKDLSWNNLLDADAAWRLASDLAIFSDQPAVAVIKHGNPCGVAIARNQANALRNAWDQDATSAFGSIISVTHPFDEEMARFIDEKFCEVILAPAFTPEARQILSRKKSLRLLKLDLLRSGRDISVRSISGGFLVQDEDMGLDPEMADMTSLKLDATNREVARFGAIVAKHLKSNAIALVCKTPSGFELAGAGMGQPNRIDSLVRLALPRAHENLKRMGLAMADTVLASDAFFPFADTVESAAAAGIKAIVQPGGSIRDSEVIEACNKLGVAMAFTGRRHFRH
ncbi:bifunctional phosphoribosylaminoimidazolecarboxamide formyltransferase/IMP cyclohydrolase PurH [bacterium]|nr:bifunctional phosphoribosylaminoimidazolecarboxamide formyltransferase/IMP cyclohydrolase PurH [bacterium]